MELSRIEFVDVDLNGGTSTNSIEFVDVNLNGGTSTNSILQSSIMSQQYYMRNIPVTST